MKRLLNSSKYWLAVHGLGAMGFMWWLSNDVTLTIVAGSLFGGGIVATAGEDIMKRYASKEPSIVENADKVEVN